MSVNSKNILKVYVLIFFLINPFFAQKEKKNSKEIQKNEIKRNRLKKKDFDKLREKNKIENLLKTKITHRKNQIKKKNKEIEKLNNILKRKKLSKSENNESFKNKIEQDISSLVVLNQKIQKEIDLINSEGLKGLKKIRDLKEKEKEKDLEIKKELSSINKFLKFYKNQIKRNNKKIEKLDKIIKKIDCVDLNLLKSEQTEIFEKFPTLLKKNHFCEKFKSKMIKSNIAFIMSLSIKVKNLEGKFFSINEKIKNLQNREDSAHSSIDKKIKSLFSKKKSIDIKIYDYKEKIAVYSSYIEFLKNLDTHENKKPTDFINSVFDYGNSFLVFYKSELNNCIDFLKKENSKLLNIISSLNKAASLIVKEKELDCLDSDLLLPYKKNPSIFFFKKNNFLLSALTSFVDDIIKFSCHILGSENIFERKILMKYSSSFIPYLKSDFVSLKNYFSFFDKINFLFFKGFLYCNLWKILENKNSTVSTENQIPDYENNLTIN